MLNIRTATDADAQALAVLLAQLGYPADAHTLARRLHAIAGAHAGVVLVAESDAGRVQGMAHVLPQYFIQDEPFAELAAMVVADGARGEGTGAALLAAAEAWARGQGLGWLWVRSNVIRTRTHRFYLRAGYAEHKRQAVFAKRL